MSSEFVVDVDGGVLAGVDEGEGPPLVLIHGAGQNLHAWDEIASLLSPMRRVVRYDLRGCGRSAVLAEPSFAIHAEDLSAVVEARGLSRPTVVGFSLGGYVGLRWVGSGNDCAAFVSVEGPLASYRHQATRLGQEADFVALRREFESAAFTGTASDLDRRVEAEVALTGASEREVRRHFTARSDGLFERRPTVDERMAHQRALWDEDSRSFYESATAPVVLALGVHAFEGVAGFRAVRAELLAELTSAHPEVRVVHLDAGHDVVAEQPIELCELIRYSDLPDGAHEAVAPDGSPVALYLKLPGDSEATFIHDSIPLGAPVLELGCGAGRITRHLVRLGHRVTGVDNSLAMLAQLRDLIGTEAVCVDIADLDMRPRQWPVVLLASHLINGALGPRFLETAVRHVTDEGCVLVQRHEPGWIDQAEPSTVRRPGLTIAMLGIERSGTGVMTATMIYTIEGRRHTQTFTAFEMDDERLSELATSLGCVVDEVLGQHRMWVRLRRQAAPRTSDRFLTRDEETP